MSSNNYTNNLITTAALSTIGAALIAAISSFWISSRHIKRNKEEEESAVFLLNRFADIARRLDGLEHLKKGDDDDGGDGGISSPNKGRRKLIDDTWNASATNDQSKKSQHKHHHREQQLHENGSRQHCKSTTNTNRNVIPEGELQDDLSYTPNAPPRTIRTREHRHSIPLLPDASHGTDHDSASQNNYAPPKSSANRHNNHNSNCTNTTHASSLNLTHEPVPIVLISDPGQDLDDEMMFIMARHLVSLNLISLQGIVANLAPSFARARLTRGTLDLLGLHRVPVGIGTDGGDVLGKHSSDQFEQTASSYIVHNDGEAARGLESGNRLLQRLYDEAGDIEYVDVYDEEDVEYDDDNEREGEELQQEDFFMERKKKKPKEMNKKPKKVARGGLVLVITSSLKDVAIFARDNPTLFAAKTREVVVMGGCKPVPMDDSTDMAAAAASASVDQKSEEAPTCDTSSIWSKLAKVECEPDSANNNTFDTAASTFFYSQCQKMNVTFTVVTRFAAYAAKMPRSVYDDLALTGSSIGWRLRNSQRTSIDQLWQRACSKDPLVRKGLPPRCDRKWFIDTFCGGDDDEARCCDDTAWDLVTGFMQYDTIALLAAIPQVREKYFEPLVLPPLETAEKVQEENGSKMFGSKSGKAGISRKTHSFVDNAGEKKEEDETVIAGHDEDASEDGAQIIDRRFFMSRSSSDPGPLFIQRAIAKANEDNKIPENLILEPLELPGSNIPVAFGKGTRNIIGISDKEHNLKDPSLLINLLTTGYRSGILCNHHTQPHVILCLQLRWDNLADTLLTCLMLRSLWDMRLASVLGVIVSIFPTDSDAKETADGDMDGIDKDKDLDGEKNSRTNGSSRRRASEGSNDSTDAPDQSQSTLRALAESIRDTLSSIGLSHVKFLIVSGKNMDEHKTKSTEALLELYESAPPIGVTLVLTATFTSVWPFAESYPELFRDKTVRVVHTGGALIWPARWGWASLPCSSQSDDQSDSSNDLNSGALTEEKVLVPDPAAQNHRLDLSSARQFYKRAQALSVPMVILSRHVAKECCIPRNFFDVLGSHGGLVGKRICDSERNSLLNLWRCACAPFGSAARGNLPERCDASWFAETFCAGREAKNEEGVWESVEAVNLYSPIALLAALPGETVKSYFQTMPFTVRSATHHVVGLTEEVPLRNVRNPSELRSLVVQSLLSAALANESEFGKGAPPKVPIRMNHEQRRRVCNSRDSVLGNSVNSFISTESNNVDDDDMWTFSENARRELFSRTVVRTSKNLVMPKDKKRLFVTGTENRDVIGFIPPYANSNNEG